MSYYFNKFLLLSILGISLSCSGLKIQSQRSALPLQVDGDARDWQELEMVYHENPPFVVGTANNDTTLHLMFRFNDARFARMLLSRGFTIWFDKSETCGLDYMGRMPDMVQGRDGNVPRYVTQRPIQTLTSDDFTALQKETGAFLSLSEIPHLEAAFAAEQGLYCLEISVPLIQSETDFGVHQKASQKVDIHFEIKELELTNSQRNSGMQPGTRMPGEKSGSMRGGGRRGSGGMSGMGQRPDTGSQKIKLKIHLAE